MNSQDPEDGRRSRIPRFVFVLVFLEIASFGLSLPVLPVRVRELTGGGQASITWYGLCTFALGLGFLISVGVTGTLSDRVGRRPLMLMNCAGLAAGNLLCAIAPNVGTLVLARLWCGLFNCNGSLAQAYLADLATREERGRCFGWLGAMQGLGFLIGPLVGGQLGAHDTRIPFVLAAVMAGINLAAGFWLLPESLRPESREVSARRTFNPLGAILYLTQPGPIRSLLPGFGLMALALNTFLIAWVPFTHARFGWGPQESGWSLFGLGFFAMLSRGVLFPRMLKLLPLRWICLGALGASVLTYVAYGWVRDGRMIYLVMAADMLGLSCRVAFMTLASTRADETSQGRTLGGLESLNNLTLGLAPVLSSILLLWMTDYPAQDWQAGLPLYFCAGLLLIALGLSLRPVIRPAPSPRGSE
jgi:MFS transporter, DHA1 family, tetracycline resistance protein